MVLYLHIYIPKRFRAANFFEVGQWFVTFVSTQILPGLSFFNRQHGLFWDLPVWFLIPTNYMYLKSSLSFQTTTAVCTHKSKRSIDETTTYFVRARVELLYCKCFCLRKSSLQNIPIPIFCPTPVLNHQGSEYKHLRDIEKSQTISTGFSFESQWNLGRKLLPTEGRS